jgi:molybdopterin synthase catalytic subunit
MTTKPIIEVGIKDSNLPVEEYRAALPISPESGGYVCFEGHVRNVNNGRSVSHLEYEVYDTLALKELRKICEEACERFHLNFARAVHRKGVLKIGEPAVIIQVLSKHRKEAFEGCRFIIDRLKSQVPVWKREHYTDGSHVWTQCHDHGPHNH